MKVHITGAHGFVGSALRQAMQSSHHSYVEKLAEAEAVVHLAGIAHRHATRAELDKANVQLADQVGRAAAARGIPMVFISSVKVHGECSDTPLCETSAIAPADRYAASKARAEERLHAIGGLRLTVLRPPLVYGAGVRANFLSLMRALDRGYPLPLAAVDNRRSLIYVGNLADAIISCLCAEGTFLVCDGHTLSTPQLCRELAMALGCPARLFRCPTWLLPRKLAGSLEVDDSAIRNSLKWQPPYTTQAGFHATVEWYHGR